MFRNTCFRLWTARRYSFRLLASMREMGLHLYLNERVKSIEPGGAGNDIRLFKLKYRGTRSAAMRCWSRWVGPATRKNYGWRMPASRWRSVDC